MSSENKVNEIKEEVKHEEIHEEVKPYEEILEEDEAVKDEIILTLNLRDVKRAPRNKRAKKAIVLIRKLVSRFTKQKYVWISKELNEKIWERGIKKPPKKIKVKVAITTKERALVYLHK